MEMGEVVRLEEHVAELGERQPALEPDLDRILGEHVRDREMLAGVAQEVDQRQRSEPVEVVDHDRARVGREVEEPLELDPDGRDVGFERGDVEQVALGGTARRVADHARPATDDRERPAAEALQAEQPEDRHEVADVERRARRDRSRCSR